jgi:outer membrane protein assembly factor BamE (lipoprotein component of BamABCDE complex)
MSRKLALAFSLIFVLASLDACRTKVYTPIGPDLGNRLNHATQDDIAKDYGPPTSKQKLSDGGEVWAYDYRSSSESGNQKRADKVTECVRVICVFDKDRVLRDYRRERC